MLSLNTNISNIDYGIKSKGVESGDSAKASVGLVENTSLPISSSDIIAMQNKSSLNISKSQPSFKSLNYCYSHKDLGGAMVFSFPDYYVDIKEGETLVEEEPAHYDKFRKKWVDTVPEHYEKYVDRIMKPHYHLDKIYSSQKGFGTERIKNLVLTSLNDSDTEGRVTLDCASIDKDRPCPAGFYYKLGFRFNDDLANNEFDEWLKSGGERDKAPIQYGLMYLPKENIEHCLKYPENSK